MKENVPKNMKRKVEEEEEIENQRKIINLIQN